jgi:hypothetical protein
MTTHAITAISIDEATHQVVAVRWGQLTLDGDEWEVAPRVAQVIEVVDALHKGDRVVTIFPVEGHRVAGPEVQRVPYEAGREGIATVDEANQAGRTLFDLPRFNYE